VAGPRARHAHPVYGFCVPTTSIFFSSATPSIGFSSRHIEGFVAPRHRVSRPAAHEHVQPCRAIALAPFCALSARTWQTSPPRAPCACVYEIVRRLAQPASSGAGSPTLVRIGRDRQGPVFVHRRPDRSPRPPNNDEVDLSAVLAFQQAPDEDARVLDAATTRSSPAAAHDLSPPSPLPACLPGLTFAQICHSRDRIAHRIYRVASASPSRRPPPDMTRCVVAWCRVGSAASITAALLRGRERSPRRVDRMNLLQALLYPRQERVRCGREPASLSTAMRRPAIPCTAGPPACQSLQGPGRSLQAIG